MKRAYSYRRFSTAEQIKGKSLERQTEGAEVWCKQHGVELDTELKLSDLGVSAFRGKNADTGALASFLKEVHVGQVQKGSYLLIETFDRLSRETAYDAQLTLQNIINAGITVVTLLDGKQYNVSILRADPLALIYAILLMSRAHEESATKSKRVADAWRRKREDMLNGKILTSVTPGWIRLDSNRKPKLIPERARIVRQIFAMFLGGDSRAAIAVKLNRKNVPTFGGARWWNQIYITTILSTRAVIGEFQAHRHDHTGPLRKRRRVPEGEPIPNYWPRVIDNASFTKAAARLVVSKGRRQPQSTNLKNVLAGLACCPVCGTLMTRVRMWQPKGAIRLYLTCTKARAGGQCKSKFIPLPKLEAALIQGSGALAQEVPDTTAELLRKIAEVQGSLEQTQNRIADTALLLGDLPSRTLATRVKQDEAECERLQAELDTLNAQLHYGGARRLKDNVARMQAALQWHAQDPSDIVGVNAALRECFEKIVVDYQHSRLELFWHHGQTTALPY